MPELGRHDPIVVEVTRGARVESHHLVDAVVVDGSGTVVAAWGDPDRPTMPRSAIKPIQALPLIETGAADAFGLSDAELALACASHNGERPHVDAVTAWLDRAGIEQAAYECGAHRPIFEKAADELLLAGVEPGPRHNNCSGKHAGFLSVCAYLGIDPTGYLSPEHELQSSYITPSIEEMCGISLATQQPGADGCGIPVWTVPLRALAAGWAKLDARPAGRKLTAAMMAEPFFVAGTGRSSTIVMQTASRPVAAKGGAEGVYCALVAGGDRAIALKVRDGASRAADAAIAAVLGSLGITCGPLSDVVLRNRPGVEVGEVRVQPVDPIGR